MKKQTFLLTGVLILLNAIIGYAQPQKLTGLRFASHEVIKDKRTSLNLNPEGAFSFEDGFYMEFDARFRPGDGYYGYVVRIIGDEDTSIDLVANLGLGPQPNFSLILKDNIIFSYKWEDIPNGRLDSWTNVRIRIDPRKSEISLSLNGNHQEKKVSDITDLKNFKFIFGACRVNSFLTTDVAPMALKDIRLYDKDQELFRRWKLSEHDLNQVHDEIARAKATVSNPIWEIDKHLKWQNEQTLSIENLIGVAKDEVKGRIFFVNDHAVLIYRIANATLDTLYFGNGQPYHCAGNQMIYNRFTNELWSYNFDKTNISKFDFETRNWSLSDPHCDEPNLWHHNKFISPADTSLITFGGYGFYTYKSVLKQWSPKVPGNWVDINFQDQIQPRYMSGLGLHSNGKLLIFGGYGSKTGRQELSPEFYYNLYSVDPKNFSVDKLWDLDSVTTPFVPGADLIVNNLSDQFYTLVYNPGHFETSLRLATFRINEPEKRFYADSIPYKFLDTNSWSTLFLNKGTNELIALTVYNSEINLHTLAFPPLLPEEVYQQSPDEVSEFSMWSAIGITSLTLLTIAFVVMLKKNRSKKQVHGEVAASDTGHLQVIDSGQDQRRVTSAIYLLGGFLTYDKEGNDITSGFTPTLKQLFILIFLASLKNNKGVSSVVLKDTLWFDKSGLSARNNRNVNISKLRVLLEKIGNLELESNKTNWKINLTPDVYCDYADALHLVEKSRSPDGLEKDEIFRLIRIASNGDICPNIQTEWMDEFKIHFANEIIDTLILICNSSPDIQGNNSQLCNVADCILKYDSLNEEAIKIKCSALYRMGKKGLAKHSFNSFCREYKALLGDDLTLSFNTVINR